MKIKPMIMLVLALGCELIATVGVTKALNKPEPKLPSLDTEKIYLSTKTIELGKLQSQRKGECHWAMSIVEARVEQRENSINRSYSV